VRRRRAGGGYDAVTPGVPKPARELYGVMLLKCGMAKDALAAFEETLRKEPNRLEAYVGAARAAEKSGDLAKARDYYGKVIAIRWRCRQDPDGDRRGARVSGEEIMKLATLEARTIKTIARALPLAVALAVLASPARAQSHEIIGYSGDLGE
jgi:hypothetical protein